MGCRTGTPANMAGGPVRQPYAGVDLIPQSAIYEFGYCSTESNKSKRETTAKEDLASFRYCIPSVPKRFIREKEDCRKNKRLLLTLFLMNRANKDFLL